MGICKGFASTVRGISKGFDGVVLNNIKTALLVTTAMKDFFESPALLKITNIIPGDADEKVRLAIVRGLSKAIDEVSIVDTCIHLPLEQKAICFINEINKRSPTLRKSLLMKIASVLAAELDGNRFIEVLYDAWTQGQFSSAKMESLQ